MFLDSTNAKKVLREQDDRKNYSNYADGHHFKRLLDDGLHWIFVAL